MMFLVLLTLAAIFNVLHTLPAILFAFLTLTAILVVIFTLAAILIALQAMSLVRESLVPFSKASGQPRMDRRYLAVWLTSVKQPIYGTCFITDHVPNVMILLLLPV